MNIINEVVMVEFNGFYFERPCGLAIKLQENKTYYLNVSNYENNQTIISLQIIEKNNKVNIVLKRKVLTLNKILLKVEILDQIINFYYSLDGICLINSGITLNLKEQKVIEEDFNIQPYIGNF